ncbi:MAG: phage tail protein, partial [Patescibacteria group bacterium]
MNITVKVEGIKEALEKFDPRKVKRAAAGALNRAVRSGRTEALSLIRETWAIKRSDIDRKINIKSALASNLSAILSVSGKPINLLYFNARQISAGKAISVKRKGRLSADAQIKTGRAGRGYSGVTSQIQLSHKTVLPKAFISRATKGGIPLVLIRSSKAHSRSGRKEGLIAVKVITEASIFKQGRVMEKVIAK